MTQAGHHGPSDVLEKISRMNDHRHQEIRVTKKIEEFLKIRYNETPNTHTTNRILNVPHTSDTYSG